jgi:aminopeptidase N
MNRALAALVLNGALVTAAVSSDAQPGHRLPEGPPRPLRDRAIDVQHLQATLRVDMAQETVAGTADITFVPLRQSLREVTLDAATGLDVASVTVDGSAPLTLDRQKSAVRITLPEPPVSSSARTLRVTYATRPKSGLYFFPGGPERAPQAWNYGEGGIHYGWLPVYNGTDDRFTLDLRITAPRPLVVVANGTLRGTVDNADGTRTFHWVQAEPIPNYLIALQVGDFARVPLDDARLKTRTVPLAVWTIPGTEKSAAFAFGATPRMVEFFSRRFGYEYPWPRYDQVTLREFSGAMETTGAVGFSESFLRGESDPPDSGPSFGEAFPAWTGEDTIAHELAHHWFGDLVTCRSLASLWLNESFASFAHLLWNGEAHGEDDLTYQRWRYLNRYLDYVRATGTVRPLEFDRYATPGTMYQEETTYLKGALVLHMLRHIVGDAAFFRGISLYLHRHAFGAVESIDLEAALREASGRNLRPFFEDWVRGGGGHPSFDISYRYVPARRQVDLSIRQVHADLPFENAFHLPVQVEVVTAGGARVHDVEVDGWSTQVSLPADGPPSYVVFDKGAWLVSETRQERPLEETLRQLAGGGLAEKLRAARELSERFARRSEAVAALAAILADHRAHWGLRQEAAVDLGKMGGQAAVVALVGASGDADRRTRRAVALGLTAAGGAAADAALRRIVETDSAQDVVAVAAAGVGKLGEPGARAFLERQLPRVSSWWDALQLGVIQGLAELKDPGLGPVFERYVDPRYSRHLRQAALAGWTASAPDDPRLPPRLRELARDRNLIIRDAALGALGRLHRAEDVAFLREYAEAEVDENLAVAARDAAESIEAFTKAAKP